MLNSFNDLTVEELNLLVLALDYFLCNSDSRPAISELSEDLLLHLDILTESLEDSASLVSTHLVEKSDNLLIVDFTPTDS